MTDTLANDRPAIAPRRIDVTSEAARAAIRRRYRAEARFKSYGLVAIAIAAVFLAVLLIDVVRKAIPAFTEHTVVLDIDVPSDLVPADKRSDAVAIRSADYFPVMRDALKKLFPGLEGRSAERTLTRLMSSGATDALISKLVADPVLIGKTVRTQLLLSDDADLYLKRSGSIVSSRSGPGTATLSDVSGDVVVTTSGGAFVGELASVKQAIAQRASALEREAARVRRSPADSAQARAKELSDAAAALRTRAGGAASEEQLDAELPSLLVAINGGLVKATKIGPDRIEGELLLPPKSAGTAHAGQWRIVTYRAPESQRKVTDREIAYLEHLKEVGVVRQGIAWRFFTSGDSREPELAGIRGALTGTALTLLVTLVLCLPIGVMAAIYLEEFAPKNRLTDLIEVNINNLAAVPSIVFGLLGLAMFLNFFDLPRSAPLVGGLVLALLVLPTIIIASRAALKAVPPSIKEAALGVGASHQQAIFHHVLPLAMPGIMTGTIIGMAHALGETAPLLMIGMVAFIVDVPTSITDASTVLPVQIYLWSDLPELAFQAKTAAAIVVLLVFLFVMNGAAIWLRKRFERRW